MGSDFDSFDQSALGGFIESSLGARGTNIYNYDPKFYISRTNGDVYIYDNLTSDYVLVAELSVSLPFVVLNGVCLCGSGEFIYYWNGEDVEVKPIGLVDASSGELVSSNRVVSTFIYQNKLAVICESGGYTCGLTFDTPHNLFEYNARSFTYVASTNICALVDHGFSDNSPIVVTVSGAGIAGGYEDEPLVVDVLTSDTFYIKVGSAGGSPISITADDAGVLENCNTGTVLDDTFLDDGNGNATEANAVHVNGNDIFVVGDLAVSSGGTTPISGLAHYNNSEWVGFNNDTLVTNRWFADNVQYHFDVCGSESDLYFFEADMTFPHSGAVTDSINGIAHWTGSNFEEYASTPAGVTQNAGNIIEYNSSVYYDYGTDGLFYGSSGTSLAAVSGGVINDTAIINTELYVCGDYTTLDGLSNGVQKIDSGNTITSVGTLTSASKFYNSTQQPRTKPTTDLTYTETAYSSTDTVEMSATSIDQDGVVLTSSIVWASDVDGSITTGSSISTTLSEGAHTISASGTDSYGMKGTDTVNIYVGILINSVTPNIGDEAGATSVTISGDGFNGSTTVTFDGNSATNIVVNSRQELTCDTPSGSGTVDVVVSNGVDSDTSSGGYTYFGILPPPPP